jgi:hypothetical protein
MDFCRPVPNRGTARSAGADDSYFTKVGSCPNLNRTISFSVPREQGGVAMIALRQCIPEWTWPEQSGAAPPNLHGAGIKPHGAMSKELKSDLL